MGLTHMSNAAKIIRTAAAAGTIGCLFLLTVGACDDESPPPVTTCVDPSAQRLHLPQVRIDTDGREIENVDKITASFSVTFPEGSSADTLVPCHDAGVIPAFTNVSSSIGIEVRGESSRFVDKKNFDLETRDAMGENNNISILGLPSENDWILNGTAYERTYTNNVLAFAIYRDIMGHYAPRTCYVELTINDTYYGVYALTEQIKRDGDRVDIKKLTSDETSGDDLTGGYIFAQDKDPDMNERSFNVRRRPTDTTRTAQYGFYYVYPDGDDIVTEQETYLSTFVTGVLEQLDLAAADSTVNLGEHIDITSLADTVILFELSFNKDAYALSTYFHKEKDDPLLYFGPPWDYDLAFGTIRSDTNVPTNQLKITEISWSPYFRMWQNPTLQAQIKQRYRALRTTTLTTQAIFNMYDAYTTQLMQSDALYRDYRRWYNHSDPCASYQQLIDLRKAWLTERLAWLDSQWMM